MSQAPAGMMAAGSIKGSAAGSAVGGWLRAAAGGGKQATVGDMARAISRAMTRGLALFALGLLNLPIAVVILVGIVLSFGLGMIFLVPPIIRLLRMWTRYGRRLATAWSGIEIEDPYAPPPPPPVRQPDGWYREGRQLYRSPRMPAFHRRLNWMLKDPATWRDLAWLVCYPFAGALIAALPVGLPAYGVWLMRAGEPLDIAGGLLMLIAGLLLAPRIPRVFGLWNRLLLGPTETARLAWQVQSLARSRTDAVDAQTAELHRIERDLHDGAQARLVAVGMTLGAIEQLVETDPNAAKALLAKAREASSDALAELRRLVRGIHPPVLAERGLGDAVRALALDSPLDVTVTVELPARPEPPVESAAYFAISELLTNAARHSEARKVTIDISPRGTALRITVTDDGIGGADPSRGSGLRGLERRLAAFDGVLALSSPPGGPTVATVELPAALPGNRPPTPQVPKWKHVVAGVCWGLFWLPLFPQGIVALVIKLIGGLPDGNRSWFLALYLPEPISWITLTVLINLGIVMLVTAARFSAEIERTKSPC